MDAVWLGHVPYGRALEVQLDYLERRARREIPDTLLLLTHPHVYTFGRAGDSKNLLVSPESLAREGIAVERVSRGGDVTYHGPGQLVGYPIMKVESFPGSIRGFVSSIESGLISLLRSEFHINAVQRQDKYTGVWVGDRKIVAIGIAVKKWV